MLPVFSNCQACVLSVRRQLQKATYWTSLSNPRDSSDVYWKRAVENVQRASEQWHQHLKTNCLQQCQQQFSDAERYMLQHNVPVFQDVGEPAQTSRETGFFDPVQDIMNQLQALDQQHKDLKTRYQVQCQKLQQFERQVQTPTVPFPCRQCQHWQMQEKQAQQCIQHQAQQIQQMQSDIDALERQVQLQLSKHQEKWTEWQQLQGYCDRIQTEYNECRAESNRLQSTAQHFQTLYQQLQQACAMIFDLLNEDQKQHVARLLEEQNA